MVVKKFHGANIENYVILYTIPFCMKSSILDRLRDVLQLCSLCAVIVIAYNGGALRDTEAIKVLFMLLVAVGNIFFGKLFCSNMCPLGLVQEWIAGKRRREYVSIARWSVADKIQRAIKYILITVLFIDYHIFLLNVVLAIVILSIIIVGNMFFCKYLCPVNAASNIFRLTVMFMSVLLGYWGLQMAGLNTPLWVLVAALSVGGYILEIVARKAEFNISLLHVHRNPANCNNCGECIKACPFGVDVQKVKRVTDIDCNLCGECLRVCTRDAIKMGICNTRPGQNRIRGVWFAPLITLALLAVAVWMLSI